MLTLSDEADAALTVHMQCQVVQYMQSMQDAENRHVFKRIVFTLGKYANVCKCWRKEVYNSKQLFRELLQAQLVNMHGRVNCSECAHCLVDVLPCCYNISKKHVRWMCASKLPRILEQQEQRRMLAAVRDSLENSASMGMEHSMCVFLASVVNIAKVRRYVDFPDWTELLGPWSRWNVKMRVDAGIMERRFIWFSMSHSIAAVGDGDSRRALQLPCLRLTTCAFGVVGCDLRGQVGVGDETIVLTWRVIPNSLDDHRTSDIGEIQENRTFIVWDDEYDDSVLHPVFFEDVLNPAQGAQTYSRVPCLTLMLEVGQKLTCTWEVDGHTIQETVKIATSSMRRLLTRSDDESSCNKLQQAGLLPPVEQAGATMYQWDTVAPSYSEAEDDEESEEDA